MPCVGILLKVFFKRIAKGTRVIGIIQCTFWNYGNFLDLNGFSINSIVCSNRLDITFSFWTSSSHTLTKTIFQFTLSAKGVIMALKHVALLVLLSRTFH